MAGVYISFPFCAQKCTYCNFASGVFPRQLEESYVDALEAELRAHCWQWTPETLYFGGGTPSRLEAPQLERLVRAVPGTPWAEATIEAAPGDIGPDKARAWHASGINRVSLGVQSFVVRELAQTGRRHDSATVARDVEMLREAGIGNVSIDLIAGLPHQSIASFEESLAWTVRLGVPHVSVYMLEVDDDSRLGREMMLGGVRYGAGNTPSEDDVVEMYERAVAVLRAAGIERYEISNFARPGFESLHNLKYWRLEPYAGFGADAHAFDGRQRLQNVETAAEYVARWQRGESPIAATVSADLAEEHFLVGLRLAEGIQPAPGEWVRFQTPIQRFLHEGLLEQRGDMLRFTRQGLLYSNEVLQEFVNA